MKSKTLTDSCRQPCIAGIRLRVETGKLVGALAIVLIALMFGQAARAETVIFDDTFGSSTLNSASPANPDTNSTAYQMLSAKSWSGQSIATNQLRIGMVGTSSGIMECQALFTTNPVTLNAINDAIQLRVTFTNTAGLLSGTSQLGFGLYDSGGVNGSVKPVPGGLNGTLTSSQSGAATGYAQNWKGYFGQLFPSGGNNRIADRDAQTGASNQNQATATSGTSSSPANPAPANVGDNVVSSLTLTVGATYTEVLTITKNGDSSLAISNVLYAGPEPSGVPLAAMGGIATATNSTYLTSSFDSLTIAWRAATATTMDVSRITVKKLTQADLPALYNLQLNGYTNNTFSGAARIGSTNDLWNNPDWTGVYSGSTNLFTDVSILTSGGENRGVTATMTALFNNNTSDWNDGGAFNHYTGQTAGDATPGLMDQVVKVDYDYANSVVNVMTLTFSGLPTNKLATVYVYGAGNSAGQGGLWTLAAGNGGDSAVVGYDGSATGRDVTLNSSEGISWESLAGTTDGSGKLTVTATGTHALSTWWQTYMNGIQVQIGGTAPTILGLTNQTVEDGTTVILSPVVTGNPAPTYQWYENGTNMPGETNPNLTLANVTTNVSGNIYSLVAENAIGVASNSMTLTVTPSVYSSMSVTAVSPANGATGICYDTPLTVTFSDSVSLGTAGSIKIFDATNSATPVDTISAADGLVQQRHFPGDAQSFSYPVITINGNTVTIIPDFDTLTSNQTYYVTIDPKTFLDSGGINFIGLTNTSAWQFTTKPVAPADTNNIVVNGDGSGDFLTVQGAVNSVPSGNTIPRIINIRDGLYHEIVNISGKNNLTLRGQSRAGTVVGFENNAVYQTANGGGTHCRMAFKVNANDITLDNLTISNMTPQGGSQAEALMIESGAQHCVVNNCDIDSRQDTILANINSSQCLFNNSRIAGNYDYIWGGGNLYFQNCEIHTISGSSGFNVTAARTDTSSSESSSTPWVNLDGVTYSANGFSFVDCTFTADSGVTGITLGGHNGHAGGLDSWANCKFDSSAYVGPDSTTTNSYVYWQNQNTALDGTTSISFAGVQTIGVTNNDPRLLAATNMITWFYGWTPQQGVDIVSQPVSQTVTAGQSVSFTVGATGFPDPTYQWTKDTTNLVGETGATLTIPSASGLDSGTYAVIVSNDSGGVTSSNAVLTVNPPTTPATVASPTVAGDGSVHFTINGPAGSAGFGYRVWATTNITLTPVTSTWTLITNGVFGTVPVDITDPTAAGLPQRFYIITVP